MQVNTDPLPPKRLPSLRDLAALTATLLPPALVMLASYEELERRCREINVTHPQYEEEIPLVLRYEQQRRRRLRGELVVVPTPELQTVAAHG